MNRKTESIRVKQLYGIFLAATLLLGACTQEEGTNKFPQENIPISFSGNVPVMRSVKEGTRIICDDAFFKCSSLTSIVISNSVVSILVLIDHDLMIALLKGLSHLWELL